MICLHLMNPDDDGELLETVLLVVSINSPCLDDITLNDGTCLEFFRFSTFASHHVPRRVLERRYAHRAFPLLLLQGHTLLYPLPPTAYVAPHA